MSRKIIQDYYLKVEKVKQYSGSRKENQIRSAFELLLGQLANNHNLELISNLEYRTTKHGSPVIPDGTLKDALRQDWGYWESKDEFDDLDKEIRKKIDQDGYPTSNIIFEDGQTIVLFQRNHEIDRCKVHDEQSFERLLDTFLSYEPREVQDFHGAIEKFKLDLPALLTKLRALIEEQARLNDSFVQARDNFLLMCQKSINPLIMLEDIREMIIQHILSEDIFITVFSDAQFHQENNISRELTRLVNTFFKGAIRRNILNTIEPYYKVIKAAASNIQDHHEKQRFLKVLYENFYTAYNPAAADRLGIIYTPEEIVRFIIDTADHLAFSKFSRLLSDENVEILDPACGTGTFITELIEHISESRLPYKYENEIYCNEVAILPYYVANLNIEYTYYQRMKRYSEFKNICFVDTLDNLGFDFKHKRFHLFDISAENLDRIERQNSRKISIVIGNPPYNANQKNENENNKNRDYPDINKKIRDTYVKYSKAQKTKAYDPYLQFLRWSTDRLDGNGIIAFVSNNSFIKRDTHDGVRKVLADEFNEIYIVDLKGDANTSGEVRRKEGGNVFSNKIKVGIAVYFLICNPKMDGCKIFYTSVDDYATAEMKKSYLRDNKFQDISFERIIPSEDHDWIGTERDDLSGLMPIANKATKVSTTGEANTIFKFFTLGISTNRDEWVYDYNKHTLEKKVNYFIQRYNKQVVNAKGLERAALDMTPPP